MEQYLNATVKRQVQRTLFKRVQSCSSFLGLAGTHPEEYIKVLPQSFKTFLVDKEPVNNQIIKGSLVYIYTKLSRSYYVNFVDCDFCRTYKTDGDYLNFIYNKMKRAPGSDKYISFTFSLRRIGLAKTLYWLSQHFPELNIQYDYYKTIRFGNRKYFKQITKDIIQYRDSGDNMISGIIKIR